MKIYGHLVDIHQKEIFSGCLIVHKGRIERIEKAGSVPDVYILPGLIDAHIHIESSMVTPGAFAMAAVRHGTTGVVSDPHEIANVLGSSGVHYMIEDGKKVPLRFWFGAPSCVPATQFETSGAILNSEQVGELLKLPEIKYLSEMMNFPGVIFNDQEVLKKIGIAKKYGKPVDGHAPGLTGDKLKIYVDSGISTDHECSSLEEAREKLSLGMKILIREGSAARNLESLKSLFNSDPESIMLCSDDLHPEMLVKRHLNKLIARLVSEGYNPFDVIRSATVNPVSHYGLEAGLMKEGDSADFIIVDNLNTMNVHETWIAGKKVFGDNKVLFRYRAGKPINNFNSRHVEERELKVKNEHRKFRVIESFDGELLTGENLCLPGDQDYVEADTSCDILKIVVKDRYNDAPPVAGFIKGIGLKKGAFAGSVAHDSHNIISVGTNDKDIAAAINEIVRLNGGLSVSSGNTIESVQLDIAGIMTTRSCNEVAEQYERLNNKLKSLGCHGAAPFMTLSFMALLVIPELKIGDKGLFNVNKFELVPLFADSTQ